MELGEKINLSKNSVSPYNEVKFRIDTGSNSVWAYIVSTIYLPIQGLIVGIENRKF